MNPYEGKFVPIFDHVRKAGATMSEAYLYGVLATYQRSGEARPSVARLAEDVGADSRVVRGRLARLERLGLLTREMRSGRPTLYRLQGRIEKCQTPDQNDHPTPDHFVSDPGSKRSETPDQNDPPSRLRVDQESRSHTPRARVPDGFLASQVIAICNRLRVKAGLCEWIGECMNDRDNTRFRILSEVAERKQPSDPGQWIAEAFAAYLDDPSDWLSINDWPLATFAKQPDKWLHGGASGGRGLEERYAEALQAFREAGKRGDEAECQRLSAELDRLAKQRPNRRVG